MYDVNIFNMPSDDNNNNENMFIIIKNYITKLRAKNTTYTFIADTLILFFALGGLIIIWWTSFNKIKGSEPIYNMMSLNAYTEYFKDDPYSAANNGSNDMQRGLFLLPIVAFILIVIMPLYIVIYILWFIWRFWLHIIKAIGMLFYETFMWGINYVVISVKNAVDIFSSDTRIPLFSEMITKWKNTWVLPVLLDENIKIKAKYEDMYNSTYKTYIKNPYDEYIGDYVTLFGIWFNYLFELLISRPFEYMPYYLNSIYLSIFGKASVDSYGVKAMKSFVGEK